MADDLELETGNNAEQVTILIATPHDLGPNQLKDFVGDFIFEVRPGTTLAAAQDRPDVLGQRFNRFGGIFAHGINVGVHGFSNSTSTRGLGILGQGRTGVLGQSSIAGSNAVHGQHTGVNGTGVRGEGGNAGVFGTSSTAEGRGVIGQGRIGVFGKSDDGRGVVGEGRRVGVHGDGEIGVFGGSSLSGSAAVQGTHTGAGIGVLGVAAAGDTAAVLGRHSSGDGRGVHGEGGIGVFGRSSRTGFAAVAGHHIGAGVGVVGDVDLAGDGTAGVLGRHKGGGVGVKGEGSGFGAGVLGDGSPGLAGICGASLQPGSTGPLEHHGPVAGVSGKITGVGNGPGVFGEGRYGGEFKAGFAPHGAQLRLVPATTAGRPTTGFHRNGEIFMDSAATLFVCVAEGTPGTWRRVVTEAT